MNRKFTVASPLSHKIIALVSFGVLDAGAILGIFYVKYVIPWAVMVAAYTVLFLCAIFATWMFRVDVDGSAIRVRTNCGRKYELHCSDIDKIVCSKSDSGKRGPQFYITVTAKTNKFTLNAHMIGFDTMAGYLLEMLESGELKRSAVAPSCKEKLRQYEKGVIRRKK